MNTNYKRLRFNCGTVSVLNKKQNRVMAVYDTTPSYAQADPINSFWLMNGFVPQNYVCNAIPNRFEVKNDQTRSVEIEEIVND